MGVLDDAIRQHLELKRQRGADPGEIKREEDEALGKVVVTRRSSGGEPIPAGDHAQEEPSSSPVEPAVEQETMAFDPIEREQLLEEPFSDETADAENESAPGAPEAVEAPPREEPEPSLPAAGGDPVDAAPELTQEREAEDALDADMELDEDAEPDELDEDSELEVDEDTEPDELEQTPDFLEDAPEHDKLWFEQKPPKDFDF